MKKLKFLVPAILFFLVVASGFSVWRITQERKALVDDLHRRARILSKSLSDSALRFLKNPPRGDDEEDVAERISGQGRTLGILICNSQGEMVARSSSLADLKSCDNPQIREALIEQKENMAMEDSGGQSLHVLAVPLVTKKGQVLGTLTIVHDTSYIGTRVLSAVTWSTLTLAGFALAISALTYLLMRLSFRRDIAGMLHWMKSPRGEILTSFDSIHKSLFRPVTQEVEQLKVKLRAARDTAEEISKERHVHELWTPARLKAHVLTRLGDVPFIVVSNREPYMHVREFGKRKVIVPASGLVTSLDPIARATSGLWIAHGSGDADREIVDSEGKMLVPPENPSYTLKRVWLSKEEEEGYYYGFSNQTLWPLCQLTSHRPEFEEKDWKAYQAVNEKFADAILSECGKQRPYILVQDYHFTLLPKILRRKRPDAVIGLFWHITWPTPENFQICPWKKEILEGMLGANFIGFHLQSYCHNFMSTVNNLLPSRVEWDLSKIHHDAGTTAIKPFPISIQPWSEKDVPDDREFAEQAARYRQELDLRDMPLVVSVDRLDYTKGIPERLASIDAFFEKHPQYKNKVSFVQLGAPSRVHIPCYRDFATEVEKQVDRVNWKHGNESWKPVVYLKAHHDSKTVYTFLRMAHTCLISSLSDGMNLVAKEFVAARQENDGVLILSEFAGAAREFHEALSINPYARNDSAEAIRTALEMPIQEQQQRMSSMKARVAEHNVYRWAADLVQEMAQGTSSVEAVAPSDHKLPTKLKNRSG